MRGLNYSTPVKQCNCLHHNDEENLEKTMVFYSQTIHERYKALAETDSKRKGRICCIYQNSNV